MRKFLYLIPVAAVAGLLVYAWYVADGSRALLDRAIAAHGGEANVAKACKGRVAGAGKRFLVGSVPTRYSWEEYFEIPDRYKRVSHSTWIGMPVSRTELLRDGKLIERVDQRPPTIRPAEGPVRCVASILFDLVDLRKKAHPLRALPQTVLMDRPAIGFGAEAIGGGTVDYYFDKDSALLLKMAIAGSANDLELNLSGYKEFDGIPLPVFVQGYRGGKLEFEDVIQEVDFLPEINDSVFAKP